MSSTLQPRILSEHDLDLLIADLKEREATELVLLGPSAKIPASLDECPEIWRSVPVVHQLSEPVPDLATRIAELTKLKILDISFNAIRDRGAESLSSLANITHLRLAGNALSSKGVASLAVLSDITSLYLERNWIGDQGAAYLAELTKLTILHLGYTWISSEGASCLASHLASLRSLNLQHTRITDSGVASLATLVNLKHLDLSSTQIQDSCVSSLAELAQLRSLQLADTMIKEVTPLASLDNLRHLNLINTNVQDLSAFKQFLEAGMKINSEEGGASCESRIDVHGCPLINPPVEIVQQGSEAILGYFNEIELQGIDRLYEAKVLILGEGGAGKTSLLRRLYRTDLGLPNERESTKGIDIYHHEFSHTEGRPFRLNVWDFGGQQIYHSTHQFFLTKRSLYILVDDTRNDSTTIHDQGFKYWLEVVEALSSSCPVLIFQNEKAGRSKTIDESGIKGRFPNVKEIYRGNLFQADAAKCLEEAIRFHVQTLPHVGDEVPAQWARIRSHLENLKKESPCISFGAYLAVYEQYLPKDKSKALMLSQYFHDLGVFLHFQDDMVLTRTVILQNEWATEAVFKVLDDESTKAKNGYFTMIDCQRIWAESTYADMHLELLALMEKFELCYKLPDQHSALWLCPQLLPPSQPREFQDWAETEDLVLAYQYDFLPKGMISRLMVRMNRFVREPNRSWGSGVFFEKGANQLLASISSSGAQELVLRARGPERKSLMNVIASDLDALNASFEGLKNKVQKMIPCTCAQCQQSLDPTRFTEEELLERRAIGKSTIECRSHPYINVSVLELLEGLRVNSDPCAKEQRLYDAHSTIIGDGVSSTGGPVIMIEVSSANAVNTTTINAGDGNVINTGTLDTSGGVVNLGVLSDQASISIEALPERSETADQPSLRELLQDLKASVDADTQVSDETRAEALIEVTELAKAAQDPKGNVGPSRRAMNALRGLSAGLTETNKAVEESSKLVGAIKRLLPLIAAFFVG